MIAKVAAQGSDAGGLLRYLFGPGEANRHEDPHLVAAWDPLWLEDARLSARGSRTRLAHDLEAMSELHQRSVPDGHVYHVSLALHPQDSELSTEQWQELCEQAVARLGFTADEDGAGCRWVAVRHGRNAAGADHVHLVVNVVRGTGDIASTYGDYGTWRDWCREVEQRLDLVRTAPTGRGARSLSRAEVQRSQRRGQEPERVSVARRVRAAGVAAESEPEFLARLSAVGVRVRARWRDGRVVGYSAALEPEQDQSPRWFAGSSLARELSLPALRRGWRTVASAEQVSAAWRDPAAVGSVPGTGGPVWSAAEQLSGLLTELGQRSPQEWPVLLGGAAEVAVVLAERVEGGRPGPLTAAAGELTRASAVCPQPHRGHRDLRPVLGSLARSTDSVTVLVTAVLLVALVELVSWIARQASEQRQAQVRQHLSRARTALADPAVPQVPTWRSRPAGHLSDTALRQHAHAADLREQGAAQLQDAQRGQGPQVAAVEQRLAAARQAAAGTDAVVELDRQRQQLTQQAEGLSRQAVRTEYSLRSVPRVRLARRSALSGQARELRERAEQVHAQAEQLRPRVEAAVEAAGGWAHIRTVRAELATRESRYQYDRAQAQSQDETAARTHMQPPVHLARGGASGAPADRATLEHEQQLRTALPPGRRRSEHSARIQAGGHANQAGSPGAPRAPQHGDRPPHQAPHRRPEQGPRREGPQR